MLPVINSITGNVYLPVLKKNIRVKNYTLKEEKILLFNKEFAETNDIFFTIRELVKECTLDKIDVEKITITDLTVIFIKILELSKGSEIVQKFRCTNKNEDGKECGCMIDVPINLSEYEIINLDKNDNNIIKNKNVTIVFRYPSNKEFSEIISSENKNEDIIKLFSLCIEEIYDNEKLFKRDVDYTDDELYEWILNNFSSDELEQFSKYVYEMPKIRKLITVKCPKCGYEEEIEVSSLEDFFIQDIQENQ